MNRFFQQKRELNRDGAEGLQCMRSVAVWFYDFPFEETGFGAGAAMRFGAIAVATGHSGFVSGDDFVSGAVVAHGTGVDPHNAVAEAANLVELMGDEDDGAARAGDVAPLAEAFLLEVDTADGECFLDEKDFRH